MLGKNIFSSNYILLKALCSLLNYSGLGDYWYEEKHKSNLRKMFDQLHRFMVPFGFFTLICTEFTAAFGVGGYPQLLQQEAMTFALSQSCVLMKFVIIISKKRHIKMLVKEIIEVGQDIEQKSLIASQMVRIKRTLCIFSAVVYSTIYSIGFAAIFNTVKKGLPLRTIVMYPPNYGEDTVSSTLIAIFSLSYLAYMMIPMIISDILAISTIIILATKYKLLCQYLEKRPLGGEDELLHKNQLSPSKTSKKLRRMGIIEESEINFNTTINISFHEDIFDGKIEKVLIHGVSIHIKLLRCKQLVEKSFGESMSLQIINSSLTLIFLMLQILADHSLSVMMASFFFVTVLVMLAQYLFNAGELTHQVLKTTYSVFTVFY